MRASVCPGGGVEGEYALQKNHPDYVPRRYGPDNYAEPLMGGDEEESPQERRIRRAKERAKRWSNPLLETARAEVMLLQVLENVFDEEYSALRKVAQVQAQAPDSYCVANGHQPGCKLTINVPADAKERARFLFLRTARDLIQNARQDIIASGSKAPGNVWTMNTGVEPGVIFSEDDLRAKIQRSRQTRGSILSAMTPGERSTFFTEARDTLKNADAGDDEDFSPKELAQVLRDEEVLMTTLRPADYKNIVRKPFGPAKPKDYQPEYSDVALGPAMRPANYVSIARRAQPLEGMGPARRPANYVSLARRAQPMEGIGPARRPANYVSMARRAQPGALGPAKRPDNRFVSLARRGQPAVAAEEITGPSSMRIDRQPAPDGKIPAYMENRKEIAAYVPARASAQARAIAAFGSERGTVRVYNAAASQPVFVRVIRVREDWVCRDPTCHRALVGPDSAVYRIPAGATGNIEYRPFSWRERASSFPLEQERTKLTSAGNSKYSWHPPNKKLHRSPSITRPTVPSERKSCHEKPGPYVPTEADAWPAGQAGWIVVLNSTSFYSLLYADTEIAWTEALKLVERLGGPTQLDCSRAHGHATTDRIDPYAWSDPLVQWIKGGAWTEYDDSLDSDGEQSTTPASRQVVKQRQTILIRMFEILIAAGALRSGSLSQLLEHVCTTEGWGRKGHAQAIINEMRRRQQNASEGDLCPTTKTIVEMLRCRTHCIEPFQRNNATLSDPNSLAVQMIQLIPPESDAAYKILNTDAPIRDCDDHGTVTIYPGYPLRRQRSIFEGPTPSKRS